MDERSRKTLGVIGGLGPLATALFLELVILMTDAACDQEHLDMVIFNSPWVPDRTRFLLGQSLDSPLPPMIDIGRRLSSEGCHCIAVPCITAHAFYRELSEAIDRPILHMVRETARHLKDAGVSAAGICATDGTLAANLFQTELGALGIRSVVPSEAAQRDVMGIIYDDVKAGRPADREKFGAVSAELRRNGAEAIVLGCTELSLVKREAELGAGYLDAMEVLAAESVKACGYPLKSRYGRLLA
jgi:aspartate racemase